MSRFRHPTDPQQCKSSTQHNPEEMTNYNKNKKDRKNAMYFSFSQGAEILSFKINFI